MQTGKSIVIDNAYDDSRFDRSVDAKTGYASPWVPTRYWCRSASYNGGDDRFHTVSVLCVPLHNDKNQCVAVVQAVNKLAFRGPSTALSPRPSTSHDAPVTTFPEESQSLLERIGDIAGGLLHRLQLEEQAVRSWWHACQTRTCSPRC